MTNPVESTNACRSCYGFGYFYGLTVILAGIHKFRFAHQPGDSSFQLFFFVSVLFASGLLIIRKKRVGWILFIFVMAGSIVFDLVAITLLKMPQVLPYVVLYAGWWALGVWYHWRMSKRQVFKKSLSQS